MFKRIKLLYLSGGITKEGLQNAVNKNWITSCQMQEIINSDVSYEYLSYECL